VTLQQLAAVAARELEAAGIPAPTAALDAGLLARHALGWDLATWLTHRDEPAGIGFERRFTALVARRRAREPVAYIRGVQEFWGREFRVTPAVLIPRPESELLIEAAAPFAASNGAVIVDIGTGSGCVAITLALEHPDARVYATDVSESALVVAFDNASRLGAEGRVQWVRGTYLADCPRAVDLIVSNPPYIAERDRNDLAPEVRDFEPSTALFAGPDGLRDIRAILHAARLSLVNEGRLLMEIGAGQADAVAALVSGIDGLELDTIHRDLQGIPRVAQVQRRDS
jgi:release factor glutamine methyltransferase